MKDAFPDMEDVLQPIQKRDVKPEPAASLPQPSAGDLEPRTEPYTLPGPAFETPSTER